jgi:hypothetical protein
MTLQQYRGINGEGIIGCSAEKAKEISSLELNTKDKESRKLMR